MPFIQWKLRCASASRMAIGQRSSTSFQFAYYTLSGSRIMKSSMTGHFEWRIAGGRSVMKRFSVFNGNYSQVKAFTPLVVAQFTIRIELEWVRTHLTTDRHTWISEWAWPFIWRPFCRQSHSIYCRNDNWVREKGKTILSIDLTTKTIRRLSLANRTFNILKLKFLLASNMRISGVSELFCYCFMFIDME